MAGDIDAAAPTHDLVLLGTVAPGFESDEVVRQLAKLVSRDVGFARLLLSGKPTTIKSGLSEETGAAYIAALKRIGALSRLEPSVTSIELDRDVDERLFRPRTLRSPPPVGETPPRPPAEVAEAFVALPTALPTAEVLPTIWNPNATTLWSLPFTPVFGSYLQMLNWRAMGMPRQAEAERRWVVASVVVVLGSVPLLLLTPLAKFLPFAYTIVWAAVEGNDQTAFVRKRLGDKYIKRGWLAPIAIGLLAAIAFNFIAFLVLIAMGPHLPIGLDQSAARLKGLPDFH